MIQGVVRGITTRSSARQPIRAYAGLTAAETTEARARRAVDDLERAGGLDREHLMVATTTGSGWLDPSSIDTFGAQQSDQPA